MAPFPLCCVAGLASSESVATLAAAATGLVAGQSLDVCSQEFAAFKDPEAPVAGLVAEHKKIVARGNKVVRPMIVVATAAAAAAAGAHRDKHAAGPLAVAAAANAAAILLSLVLVKKVEAEIEALPPSNGSPSKKDTKAQAADSKARALLRKWAKLHSARTMLAGFAFGSTICGVLLLNKKH